MTLKDQLQEIATCKLEEEPELLQLSLSMYRNASSRYIDKGKPWEISYRSLFLEEFEKTDSFTAGYLLNLIHCKLHEGNIKVFVTDVSQGPYKDFAKDQNNAILSGIKPPFRAEFWGGKPGADIGDDGYLEWDVKHTLAPVGSDSLPTDDGKAHLPLEVGSCSLISIWAHLWERYGFTRWVYGSKYIYGFINTERINPLDFLE
jgi:hypothetical protein